MAIKLTSYYSCTSVIFCYLCIVFVVCLVIALLTFSPSVIEIVHRNGDFRLHSNCSCGRKAAGSIAMKYISTPPLKVDGRVTEYNKFTVIIPTFKRVVLLKKILSNLCRVVSIVDCVIVVWNNVQEPIPQDLLNFTCSVRLYFKKEAENSLNNRFKYYPEIRTEAVLSNDDDLLISAEDLAFQFESWKAFKHLIVGFTQRKHIEFPKNSGTYIYGKKFPKNDRRYSIILTTSAMFHVQYLDLYQHYLTQEFRAFIDVNMNCEDLFMNAVVSKYLKDTVGRPTCPGLLIAQHDIKRMEKENDSGYEGLWHRQLHKSIRDDCLNMIANLFNGLPLEYSVISVSRAPGKTTSH